MRYELMFPDQVRKAIQDDWPVILPVGVLEYHGEHLALGMDTLVVVRAIEILEKEMDMVVLPPFYYGSASYAVEPPENNGSIEVDGMVLAQFGLELFKSLLRVGFRNIHVFVHHQTDNYVNGMPTDLAFKMAARKALFMLQEKEHGEGWWGNEKNRGFYEKQQKGRDPLNLIQVHPLISSWFMEGIEIAPEHAGKLETSQMLASCPEGVDMKRLPGSLEKWYCRQAGEASVEFGLEIEKRILSDMRAILKQEGESQK